MPRRLVAVLLSPLGVLFGAWLGQYVFPETALGREFLVDLDGAAIGTGRPVPLAAIVFFFPTKLSIPLAGAGLAVAPLIGAPLAALLARRGYFPAMTAVLLGALIGASTAASAAGLVPSVASTFGADVSKYGGFVGGVSGVWYWLLAYSRSNAS